MVKSLLPRTPPSTSVRHSHCGVNCRRLLSSPNGRFCSRSRRPHLSAVAESEDVATSGLTYRHLLVEDDFLDNADALRNHFDAKFANPLEVKDHRFAWDYWHVPNQYTLLRTPVRSRNLQAHDFFPRELYESLEAQLVEYGKRRLGCKYISPIWLSYYINGCRQELHCDNVHGPWSFVLSLTNWKERHFTGGETLLLRPQVLDWWNAHRKEVVQLPELVDLVEPEFNRMTLFDPRFPHGVRPVEGTFEPREARIILHGWYTEPEPFHEGGLESSDLNPVLNTVLEELDTIMYQLPAAKGHLIFRMRVDASTGAVKDFTYLTDLLVTRPNPEEESSLQEVVQMLFESANFPEAPEDTFITIPLIFND